jgi:hypothetical protein
MTPTPHPSLPQSDDTPDERLLQALRALPTDPRCDDPAAEADLQRRILASWSARRTAVAAAVTQPAQAAAAPDTGGWPVSGRTPQAWRLVAAGLVALAAIGAWIGLPRPDPTIDELMRLDVLSQIAAGGL